MNLGWCDFCLRVTDVATSRKFYEGLGFVRVEGKDEEGWAVVVNGETRLGLFERQFMDEDAVTLNFRGGHVGQLVTELRGKGIRFESDRSEPSQASGSATFRDPDGYKIFLDSAPGETKA